MLLGYRCLLIGFSGGLLPTLGFRNIGLAVNLADRTYLVITFLKVDKPYALCGTAHNAEIRYAYTQRDT